MASSIPSLKWPLIWLFGSGYMAVASFIDFTIDREEDWAAALGLFPFFVLGFIVAWRHLSKRIEQREQWRQEKLIATLNKPWPMLPIPDWERFEYDVAVQLQEEDTNGDGALRTVRHDSR